MTVEKERPGLVVEGKFGHEWANDYLNREMQRSNDNITPEHCGILNGPLCYLAVYAARHKSKSHVETLVSLVPGIVISSKKADGSEWFNRTLST